LPTKRKTLDEKNGKDETRLKDPVCLKLKK